MPATPLAPSREDAALEVLRSLFEVKGWFRDLGSWMQLPYPTTSVMILSLVERHGPARVGELADVAHVDASVISRQLAQLEQEGLVARAPDPRDGRAHQIGITTQGELTLAEGRRRLEELVTERLAGWDAGELAGLADGVRRLLADLHG